MAIKIQGHILANGKSFWRSGGSVAIIIPANATYSVSAPQATITKGQPLTFVVSRTKDDGSQTVSYTVGGTAVAGTDYTAPSGTVSFAPGELQKQIVITTNPDSTSTGDRTITFTLTAVTGTGSVSPATATGTISDTAPGGGTGGGGTPGDTGDENAIALEDGSGVVYAENDAGYLATE